MEERERIVVIGAGIIGVSIAYNLALRGAEVTVLDKQAPGSGCTQGAFAMLIAGHLDGPETFNSLYGMAIKEWRQLEIQLKEPLPIQWGGVVNWAEPGDRADELIAGRERLKGWGVKVEDLVEGDVRRLVPGVNPGIVGAGSFLPDQGHVDIISMFAILLRHAIDTGVKFKTPVEVTGVATVSSENFLLSTSQGPFEADKIVIAAGAGSPALAKMLAGTHIPLSLPSGTLAYSKPVPHVLHRVLNGPMGSIKQNPDGRIVCGPDYRPGADEQDVSDAYGQALLDRAVEVVPALAGIELERMSIGYVPISEDTFPVIGFCDAPNRIYIATMMSGITMAPLMGRLAALEVFGEPVPLLESYRPSRFSQAASDKPSILIVGGGAFGISTTWHLSQELGAKSKYSSIRVLDRFPPPSKIAAATDFNKIIRTEYSDPVYTELAAEALEAWSDPKAIFERHFHPCGWLLCASGASVPFVEQSAQNSSNKTLTDTKIMSPAEVRSGWPVFNGKMKGYKILSSPAAGWAAARDILHEMAAQSAKRGVSFISGASGHAGKILFDETGSCIGVRAVDGTRYLADIVVLAAGANTASLLDLEGQQDAVGHTVCCIQLAPEETKLYKDMVIFANIEEGCIFPPDENGVIKVASVHMVTNFRKSMVSLPRFREDHPSDDVPDGIQKRLRRWLHDIVPELADRPWSETRLCWDVETPNNDFIISKHPLHKGLVVATGGSGHAFKFLPTIGKYVGQAIEGTLTETLEEKWRWGSSSSGSESSSTPMFTKDVWELSELPGWNSDIRRLEKL